MTAAIDTLNIELGQANSMSTQLNLLKKLAVDRFFSSCPSYFDNRKYDADYDHDANDHANDA